MKFITLLTCILFFVATPCSAQQNLWSDASTQTLKKGRLEWPLLGKKRLGIGKNMELSAQPVFFFMAPHIGLKKEWKNKTTFNLATVHKLGYPTILLKMLSREGTGGVLPETSIIPQLLTFKNEVIISKNIGDQYFIATRLGLELAFIFTNGDFPQIDLPFIYNRTAVYNNKFMPYLGVNFGGELLPKLDFEIAATVFANGTGGFVSEEKIILFWKKSDRFGVKAGVASAYGQYAYGYDFKLIPVIDLIFGFGGIKGQR